MSQLTDSAKKLASAAEELVAKNEELDSLHDQFNNAVDGYKAMLAKQVGPEVADKVASSNVPTNSTAAKIDVKGTITPPTMKGE